MTGPADIKSLIPHRYPILLVDQVSKVEPGRFLVGRKAVTVAEPCYSGHADDAPAESYAYPISLLLESWAQAAVLLACWESPNPDVLAGQVELASGLRGVSFFAPVYPGDVLEHRVELVRTVDQAAIVTGSSSLADGTKVLDIEQFTVAMRGIEVLRRD
jgi:3-hydroxyacyl-[acyl-carrier-protein] dehydratase